MDLALSITGDTAIFSDLFIDAPGLLTGYELESALIISLFTYRRANSDDSLPDGTSRRGWWADSYNPNRNDQIGSRLWLLNRAKMIEATLTLAREYVLEATNWLIEDNLASRIDVETEFYNRYTIAIGITVIKPTGTENFNFQYSWENL